MNRQTIARALFLASAVASCAFVYNPDSNAETTIKAVVTAADLQEVEALQPGPLTKSTCEPASPCLAVPLAVTGVDAEGNKHTVVTEYPVGPELVDRVKNDFKETATVVLRNLRPALAQGTKAKDHATRLACKQSIWGVDSNVRYRVNSGIRIPVKVERTVAAIAQRAAVRKPIVVTSAARTATSQADAMRTKIAMGDNVMRLYRDKRSAAQVVQAYREAKHSGASKTQVIARMAEVIKTQIDEGKFLSNHLREGAVDIRSRGLTNWERKEIVAAAQETPGVRRAIVETIPPHIHLELE